MLYVVEARDKPLGKLLLDCEQPPLQWINGVTEKDMFDYWFSKHKDKTTSNWDLLRQFFAEKNWYIRVKTW